jgi:hypothetical protein
LLPNQEVEVIDNGLMLLMKLYNYQSTTASTLKGYVVPRRGFPASAITANGTDVETTDINTRMKYK